MKVEFFQVFVFVSFYNYIPGAQDGARQTEDAQQYLLDKCRTRYLETICRPGLRKQNEPVPTP